MTPLEIAAAVAVLGGAVLQSSIGFGFALVSAPLLFAAAGPPEAVGLLTVLAFQINLLTLVTEGRRPRPLRHETVAILAWAVPGLVLGVHVLRSADPALLQMLVTAAVFTSLAVQRLLARRAVGTEPRPLPWWAAPAAGVAAGGLATSTSTSGPPIVLLLLGRGAAPAAIRDTLTTCFLALAILAAAALAATGTKAAVPDAAAVAVLAPLVAVGHLAGRRVFARLARGAYEPVLTAVLFASAAAGLLTVLI